MKLEKTYIIGAVGTAVNIIGQIADAAKNHGMKVALSGIIIDSFEKGTCICGIPVVAALKDIPGLLEDPFSRFIFALCKPEKMKERHKLLLSLGIPPERFVNFVHPLAYIAGSTVKGAGNIILSNSSVMENVILGFNNIINSNVTIEHDAVLGDCNFIAAGAVIGSRVRIGNHCFIGLNSSVREDALLGNNVFVGMHSLVISDFDDCTVTGVPARKKV